MSTARPAWHGAKAITGDLALVIGVFISVAAFMLGIVWWPLFDVAITNPLAGLLALVVGLRLGAWSRLMDRHRFALGGGVIWAGVAGYFIALPFGRDEPAVLVVVLFGASLVIVTGYGVLLGALLRALFVRLGRVG